MATCCSYIGHQVLWLNGNAHKVAHGIALFTAVDQVHQLHRGRCLDADARALGILGNDIEDIVRGLGCGSVAYQAHSHDLRLFLRHDS